ncbi:hypothetical protein CHUAL_013653 [Chamberlinius hualienensis]
MAETLQLELWDYITLSVLVALSSAVGLYHVFQSKKAKVTKDFLVSSKELGLFPLIMSTMGTFFSAIGMLGFPLEIYMNGIVFGLIVFPLLIHIPIGTLLYLPVFYKLNRNTIFEYLELRFCKTIRIFTSLLLSIQTMLYTAVVMYAPALAINQVTGLHLWASIISIGIVCIIYTSMGGIKAVVWADMTQSLVIIAVILAIAIKGIVEAGGFNQLWKFLQEGHRAEIPIQSSPYSKYTMWTMILGNPIHLIGVMSVNQQYMQRFLSNPTLKKARMCFIGGSCAVSFAQLLVALTGIVMYAHYRNCDPLLSGKIKVRDQQMALFAIESLSFFKGLSGVFVAGVMCATLSTLSSTLNTLTAVTISDYVKTLKPNLPDTTSMKLSRILVVVYGLICIALVTLTANIGGVVQTTFGVIAITGGPTATIFTVGMLLPWVNYKGATFGFICSMILPLWAWIGSILNPSTHIHAPFNVEGCLNLTWTNSTLTSINEHIDRSILNQFYDIPSFWYSSWSLIVGLATSILYTFITGAQDPKTVDSDLLFPFMRKFGKQSQDKDETNGYIEQPLMLLYNSKSPEI